MISQACIDASRDPDDHSADRACQQEAESHAEQTAIARETVWQSANNRWRVRLHGPRQRPMLECVPTGFTDWPVRYKDGSIGYDRPESIPQYVRKSLDNLRSLL